MKSGALFTALILGMSSGIMGPPAEPLPSSLETQPPEVDAIRLAKAEAKRKRKAAKRARVVSR